MNLVSQFAGKVVNWRVIENDYDFAVEIETSDSNIMSFRCVNVKQVVSCLKELNIW